MNRNTGWGSLQNISLYFFTLKQNPYKPDYDHSI